MKPYLYIVAVLLVGGSIGYFLGQRTAGSQHDHCYRSSRLPSDDRSTIETLLNRQKERLCRTR